MRYPKSAIAIFVFFAFCCTQVWSADTLKLLTTGSSPSGILCNTGHPSSNTPDTSSLSSVENINTETNFPDSYFRSVVEKFMGVEQGGNVHGRASRSKNREPSMRKV